MHVLHSISSGCFPLEPCKEDLYIEINWEPTKHIQVFCSTIQYITWSAAVFEINENLKTILQDASRRLCFVLILFLCQVIKNGYMFTKHFEHFWKTTTELEKNSGIDFMVFLR